MPQLCRVGGVTIGRGKPLAIIAGPCVLESLEMGLSVGRIVRDACAKHGLQFVFKASFDKANRSSVSSARGPGIEKGLAWMAQVRAELGVPATTDIHEKDQADAAARAVDLLQIPAFLCRQTDLLAAAGRAASKHGRGINIKKGQFMAPQEMLGACRKVRESGCDNLMLTERGTFFGYGRLVNDFVGVADMMEMGGDRAVPVCFDCTHSTQQPSSVGEVGNQVTGGRRDHAPTLALAAAAIGVDAIFVECHPDPDRAMSDAATQLRVETVPALIEKLAAVRKVSGG